MKIRSLCVAVALCSASGFAMADDCSVTIDSNDAMQFATKEVTVNKSCENFTVNLNHTGKLARNVMGHNWVLTKSDDVRAVAQEGMAAGLNNHYLKPDDARVIAFTEMIGGGETTSVTFPVSKLSADESYTFFCSFPGHVAIMQGSLTIAL